MLIFLVLFGFLFVDFVFVSTCIAFRWPFRHLYTYIIKIKVDPSAVFLRIEYFFLRFLTGHKNIFIII